MEQTKVIGLATAVAAGALSLPLLGQIDKATQGKYLYLSGGGAVVLGVGLGYFGGHPVFKGLGYALAAIGGYALVADYQASSAAAQATTTSGWVGAAGAPPPRMQAAMMRAMPPARQTPTGQPVGAPQGMPQRPVASSPSPGGGGGVMHLSPQRPGTPEFPPPTPSGGGGYKWDPGGGYGSFSDMTSSVLPTLNQTCRALNGMTVPMGTPYTFLGYAWEWDPHTHSNYRTAKISFGSPPVTVIIPASCL